MIIILCLVTFIVTIGYCSEFEWLLHSKVMHKPVGKSRLGNYAFKAHAVVHHQIFKADHTYHLQEEEYKHTITMAWWNGPLLSLIASLPFLGVGWLIGHPAALWVTSFLTVLAYYGVYETIHWCMHLPRPRKRLLERLFVPFKWLNGHHILHHRYMGKNFNVVFPLADWFHSTLLLRSPTRFVQPAPGPLIPDLQPR